MVTALTYFKNLSPQQRRQPVKTLPVFRERTLMATLEDHLRPQQSVLPLRPNQDEFVAIKKHPRARELRKWQRQAIALSAFANPRVPAAVEPTDPAEALFQKHPTAATQRRASHFTQRAPFTSLTQALKISARPPVMPLRLSTRRPLGNDPKNLLQDLSAAVINPGEPILFTIVMANGDSISLYITYQKEANQFLIVAEESEDEIVFVKNGKAFLSHHPVQLGRDDKIIFKNLTVLTIPEPTLLANMADYSYGVIFA